MFFKETLEAHRLLTGGIAEGGEGGLLLACWTPHWPIMIQAQPCHGSMSLGKTFNSYSACFLLEVWVETLENGIRLSNISVKMKRSNLSH